jgi:hypothetical protein
MKMPRVWDILNRFKALCKGHGWKTSENEDWVEVDDKYHNFLWARDIHSSSFKNIVSNRKCAIREGLSYRVVEASYIAWLFSETPPETCLKTIFENPDFCRRVALYDLSPLLDGKNQCIKLNFTDSPVFQEFERFLKKELKAEVKPVRGYELDDGNFRIAELA